MSTNPNLHPNQCSLAEELGLNVDELTSAAAAVAAIESELGKSAETECARWFALSVFRHLRKEKWPVLSECGLDDAAQAGLAEACLAEAGFSTSLRTVTKDARSKYRLVGFASSKKIQRGVLATSTKAYKIAATVIADAGLVERPAEQTSKDSVSKQPQITPPPESDEVEKTVVGRRAKRRGYSIDESPHVKVVANASEEQGQAVSMSEEEFASLDAALTKSDAKIIQQNWNDQQNEDRWSRLLGLLAGAGFFVFVALLFL